MRIRKSKTMAEKEIHSNKATDLRREAEEIARKNADVSPVTGEMLPQSDPSITQTLHELRVHQIELEMQNKELRRIQEELDAARARYFDLYDMAPAGYVTLNKKGTVIEANLTAATLLEVTRGALVKAPFSSFIIDEDKEIYFQFRRQLFETGKPQTCELRMLKKESPVFWAFLEATVALGPATGKELAGEPVGRVMMSDITELKLKEANNLLEQMVEERSKQLRQETEARKRPQEPLQAENDTILLVDDEPHALSALRHSLRKTGYEVLTAAGGIQALEIMETKKIKVIVSGEQMTGMQGSGLLAEVRRRSPHTLRILLTGHATLEMAMRAVNEDGVYRFLTKPLDGALLRLALFAATEKYNFDAERRRLQEELQRLHDGLEHRVAERTEELRQTNDELTTEIAAHKLTEDALTAQSRELEETNTALHVMLRHREEDLQKTEQKIVANLQKLVLPYIGELKQLRLSPGQSNCVEIIDANLQQVISPFLQNLTARYSTFTPREILVSNLIVEGKTSKEIADIINSAPRSVDFHRNNIRKKAGLTGKKTSLRSFLLTLS